MMKFFYSIVILGNLIQTSLGDENVADIAPGAYDDERVGGRLLRILHAHCHGYHCHHHC